MNLAITIASNLGGMAVVGFTIWRALDLRLSHQEAAIRSLTSYLQGAGVIPDSLKGP